MSILATIKSQQITARKNRSTELATILTTLYSEVANKGLNDGKRETTDIEAIAIVKKFLDNARECLKGASTQEATDLIHLEMRTLSDLLPQQLTDGAIRQILFEIKLANLKDIMGYFKVTYPGQYDGKVLKEETDKYLIERQ